MAVKVFTGKCPYIGQKYRDKLVRVHEYTLPEGTKYSCSDHDRCGPGRDSPMYWERCYFVQNKSAFTLE